jgi:hypothetical protein
MAQNKREAGFSLRGTFDTGKQPWVFSPFLLISWWDMEQFSAGAFYRIGISLSDLDAAMEKYPRDSAVGNNGLGEHFRPMLEAIHAQCVKIDLEVSVGCAQELLEMLRRPLTAGQLQDGLRELENTIRREMEVCSFFYMPSRQTEFYDQKELFGTLVNARFPGIQYDMVEAGNCYSMGRGTACVFHLMRIMEVGVQEFGKKLEIPLVTEKNWQNILDQVNKAIKALPPKAPGTVDFSQAAANLYAVKLACRNGVMHPNDKYTLEEARDMIGQVKLFMGQLATLLETKE